MDILRRRLSGEGELSFLTDETYAQRSVAGEISEGGDALRTAGLETGATTFRRLVRSAG
jgi:hypothetical protein